MTKSQGSGIGILLGVVCFLLFAGHGEQFDNLRALLIVLLISLGLFLSVYAPHASRNE